MSRPEPIDLIHGELDGANSPEESALLRDLLARDPGIREEYRQFKRLARLLASVDDARPPADLRGSIFRELPHAGKGAVANTRRSPRPGLSVRYAYGVAATLVFGLLGYLAFYGSVSGPRPDDVRGTIGGSGLAASENRVPIEGGSVQAVETPAGIRVLVELGTPTPGVEALLLYDETALTPFGVSGARSGSALLRWNPAEQPRQVFDFIRLSGVNTRITLDLVLDGETISTAGLELSGLNPEN